MIVGRSCEKWNEEQDIPRPLESIARSLEVVQSSSLLFDLRLSSSLLVSSLSLSVLLVSFFLSLSLSSSIRFLYLIIIYILFGNHPIFILVKISSLTKYHFQAFLLSPSLCVSHLSQVMNTLMPAAGSAAEAQVCHILACFPPIATSFQPIPFLPRTAFHSAIASSCV